MAKLQQYMSKLKLQTPVFLMGMGSKAEREGDLT